MFKIYKITNTQNNKIYIGSTSNYGRRKSHHSTLLRSNAHYNKQLQDDWNKYGEDSFTFEVVIIGEDDNLKLNTEQMVIEQYSPDLLYNEKAARDKNLPKTHNAGVRKVKCVETGVIYNSATEAGRILKLNGSHIHACAKGYRKTCGKHHWVYVLD